MNSGLSQNSLNRCRALEVKGQVSGRRVEDKDEAGGAKIRSGKGKKGSPTNPLITGLVNSSF
jgi:hypothetical protein